MEYDLTPAINTPLSAKGRDLISGIRAVRNDWAVRDVYRLDVPAIGLIAEFCMAAIDQTTEASHAVVVNEREAMDPAASPQLRAAHLAFLEARLHSIAEAGISYVGAHSTAAQQMLMKQNDILICAQHIFGAP